MVGRTLLRNREHLEPLKRIPQAEGDSEEEMPLAWYDPRFGYEGARSEGGSGIRIGDEMVNDFVDDILWYYGDDGRLGFCRDWLLCF